MPQQIAQLKKLEQQSTKNDNVFYALTFKPKGEPEFRVSSFHASAKELELNHWYSVTYEINGQFKNIKGKDDIQATQEPDDPQVTKRTGAANPNPSPYAPQDHPTKRRSIEVQTAQHRAVEMAIAGLISKDEVSQWTARLYNDLVTIGQPDPGQRPQQGQRAQPPQQPAPPQEPAQQPSQPTSPTPPGSSTDTKTTPNARGPRNGSQSHDSDPDYRELVETLGKNHIEMKEFEVKVLGRPYDGFLRRNGTHKSALVMLEKYLETRPPTEPPGDQDSVDDLPF